MRSFSKFLVYAWLIGAALNFAAFFTSGFDIDKLLIALLELCLANFNWADYKRGE